MTFFVGGRRVELGAQHHGLLLVEVLVKLQNNHAIVYYN